MNGGPQAAPRKSVWPKILLGCLVVVILGAIGIVVLLNFGARQLVHNVAENAKNPQLRADKAKRMLGAAALPAGYYPISGTFEIPFLTHVELSDKSPDKNGYVLGFDKRGFIFTEAAYTHSSEELEKFFTGAADAPRTVEKIGTRLRPTEDVSKGTINVGNETIRYRAVRGRVEQKEYETEGPLVLMWIDCPGQKRERYATWFSPDESMLEEASIKTFMSQFDLCRAK